MIFDKVFNVTTIKTAFIIFVLFIIYFSFKIILKKVLLYQKSKQMGDIKKFNTLRVLFTNLFKYFLIVIGILVVLNSFGFKVSSVIAGLGIFSAVLALSLQDSLKDFFSGIFIILENQFNIGDIIEVNKFKGEVVFLGFKSTRIKAQTGEVKIISNRNISEVINYSKNKFKTFIDITVLFENDNDKFHELLDNLCKNINLHYKNDIDLKFLGINKITDTSIIYRLSIDVKYSEINNLQRKIFDIMKKEFDREKISYPQLEVHHGE